MPSPWLGNDSKDDRCAICVPYDRVGLIPVCWSSRKSGSGWRESNCQVACKPTPSCVSPAGGCAPPDGFRAHRSVRAADGQGRVDIGPSAVVQT